MTGRVPPAGRVLVTGSSGRVGRAVVARLCGAGVPVTGFDRRAPEGGSAADPMVVGDIGDVDADLMTGVDAVVHLGAVQSWRDEAAEDIDAVNVRGTRRLLDAATAAGVRRVVFASSGDVYPEVAPQRELIDETHPREPRTPYGLSKVLGEELVAFYHRTGRVDGVILRLCHVQDPVQMLDPDADGEGPRRWLVGPRLRLARARGEVDLVRLLEPLDRPGEPRLYRPSLPDGRSPRLGMLTPGDVAAGVVAAVHTPAAAGRSIGVGPDESVLVHDFVDWLAHAAGLEVVPMAVPHDVDYRTSNALAREILGFRPAVSYREMAAQAGAHYRKRAQAIPSSGEESMESEETAAPRP